MRVVLDEGYTCVCKVQNFVAMLDGSRVPISGPSGLEFLDLVLFTNFARQGVTHVDWGTNPIPHSEQLLAYKKRYGITEVRTEVNIWYTRNN